MRKTTKLLRFFTDTPCLCYKSCCWGIVILFFMSMQVAGCSLAPKKIPPYKADAFNTYKNQVAKNDLHIAVWSMMEKEQQEKYFGVVLTDVGVLPVFIIAENRNASQRFMLRDDLISLQNKTTKQSSSKAQQTDAADDAHLQGPRKGAAAATAASMLILPVAAFGGIAASFSVGKKIGNIKAIQDNMFDKTLYTQTVLPGKTAEGFAFFKMSDGNINLKDFLLRIQVTDEGSQSIHNFEFGL